MGLTMAIIPPGCILIEGLVLVLAEDVGEVRGQDAAQKQVRIRYCEISTLAITHRSWVGTRRLRARLIIR